MRVIIDAMGAPTGGMNLYATELVRAWSDSHPEDDLLVVGGEWVAGLAEGFPNVTARIMYGTSAPFRFFAQVFRTGRLYRRARADALVSVSTIASPLVPSKRRVAIIHDWRHRIRPEEFGRGQRAYRRLWVWSIRGAGTTVAISEKTAAETRRFARPRRLVTIPNGTDHARTWVPDRAVFDSPMLVTFGHYPNKRPELVIDALARMRSEGSDAQLTVLGATDEYREELRAQADRLGIADALWLPGYVTTDAYRRLLQSCDAVVMASTDEGFGLPLVEAAYFGIPTVATVDSGLGRIHGNSITLAEPDPESIAAALTAVLAKGRGQARSGATWTDVVSSIRALVA